MGKMFPSMNTNYLRPRSVPMNATAKKIGTEGKTRVSFDLGPSRVASLTPSSVARRDETKSVIANNTTSDAPEEPTKSKTSTSSQAFAIQNISDIFAFTQLKNPFYNQEDSAPQQKTNDDTKSAKAKQNRGKVTYTYQAQVKSSSPSYMASTASSRSRSLDPKTSISSGRSLSLSSSKSRSSRNPIKILKMEADIASTNSSNSSIVSGGDLPSIGNRKRNLVKSSSMRRHSSRRFAKGMQGKSISSLDNLLSQSSLYSVILKDRFLVKTFSYLGLSDLVAIRSTCKKWYEIISSEAPLRKLGVICLRRGFDGMSIFNRSMYVWTQFRLFISSVFDFTEPVQQEFWNKHGKTMSYLQIRNGSMTLSALVEILARCPNLEHFTVTWTAEMYSFSSDMIKKYYGIQFRNGAFVKLHELIIDKSYFLTDNALWSLLKWCGGAVHKLALTCIPDDPDDSLSKLKPRWSIEPIQNYAARFGYSGNFRFLDFSGSNFSNEDLKTLARTDKLQSLIGIKLSSCKIDDDSLQTFIVKKGLQLEELHVDQTHITEKAFEETTKLPKLKLLNISGKKGNFHNLDFFPYLKSLTHFICSETVWLTYTTLSRPLEAFGHRSKQLKRINLSSSVNLVPRVDLRMNKTWFANFARLCSNLVELNLNSCSGFANEDNFIFICKHLCNLEKLCLRDWVSLTDEVLVGSSLHDIYQHQLHDGGRHANKSEGSLNKPPTLANLKYLSFLDLGGCKKLTDVSVQFAILPLPSLKKLSLEKTDITNTSIQLLSTKSSLDKVCVIGCENVATTSHGFLMKPTGRLLFLGRL